MWLSYHAHDGVDPANSPSCGFSFRQFIIGSKCKHHILQTSTRNTIEWVVSKGLSTSRNGRNASADAVFCGSSKHQNCWAYKLASLQNEKFCKIPTSIIYRNDWTSISQLAGWWKSWQSTYLFNMLGIPVLTGLLPVWANTPTLKYLQSSFLC